MIVPRPSSARRSTVADPTPIVRAHTYERDGERCCSCGARTGLQYQHRDAVGMGGSKIRPLLEEGVTSCSVCNPAYEGALQHVALKYGWKVRGWVKGRFETLSVVPVYYLLERTWYRLTRDGLRVPVSKAEAMAMMHEVYGEQYDEELGLIA